MGTECTLTLDPALPATISSRTLHSLIRYTNTYGRPAVRQATHWELEVNKRREPADGVSGMLELSGGWAR